MKLKLFYLFFLLVNVCFAQKKWTLEDCLVHASENNINIKQSKLNTIYSKNDYLQSKINLLPTINANASQSLNFGRNIDPYTNLFTLNKVRYNNLGANSNFVLFSGFQKINNIKKNSYDYLASKFDSEKIANDISINIITAFLQLLYLKELEKVHLDKISLSLLQVDRIEKMVEVGRLPKGDFLQTESQLAQEELQLVNVKNELDLANLNLKQLLDLEMAVEFDIVDPDIDIDDNFLIQSSDTIYKSAYNNLPNIKSAINRLKSSQKSLAIAKGARSPQIIISGSLGTGYSDDSKLINLNDGSVNEYPSNQQLKDNFNQTVSISVSLPIFNGFQVYNSISQSKIALLQAEYSLKLEENKLRKEIEQANTDALASHKKYLANKKSVLSLIESFRYTEEKYDMGIVSTHEYNESKNRLFQSEADLIQAKYDYIFKIKILDFYLGNKLTF